jgi:hypothetical protein
MASTQSASNVSSAKFQYSSAPLSLSARSIRLLQLQRNEASDKPTCIFRSYAIDEPHKSYTALSYTWGENVRHDDILLNGRLFPVARNLWSFLGQMMSNADFTTLFWIDAVCIDQTSIQERNHQVQMMRQIYSNAELVLVWLGEDDEKGHGKVAMKYLVRRKPFSAKSYLTRPTVTKPIWARRQATAVLALCERSYWTRIWIVQEVFLAERLAVHCGTRAMRWHHLQQFFEDLELNVYHARAPHTRISLVLDSPAAKIVRAKARWGLHESHSLITLTTLCQEQVATDVRDMIYALHGLAADTDDMLVNYDLSPRQLLVVVLQHSCFACGSSNRIRSSENKLLRIGQRLRNVLRVHYYNDQLKRIILAAAEQKEEEERKTRGERMIILDNFVAESDSRSTDEARGARHAVMSKARLERPWSTSHALRRSKEAGGLRETFLMGEEKESDG